MGYYARHNDWYSDCCKGKYKFDEKSTGDAGRDLCDVCDMPLPDKNIPIGAPIDAKSKKAAVAKAATAEKKAAVAEKKKEDKENKEATAK